MSHSIPEHRLSPISPFRLIPPAASGVAICVSCLVLTGWAVNLSALRSVIPGQPQMVPNTAVTFILASVTLWMLWREKRFRRTYALTWLCAVAVILIGSLTLAEYLTGA